MAINTMITRLPIGIPISHTIYIQPLWLPYVRLATICQIGQHMFIAA